MEQINKFLIEYLGEFTPVFIEMENIGTYMFLDVMWLLKAVLLCICVIYTLKGMFALTATIARGL